MLLKVRVLFKGGYYLRLYGNHLSIRNVFEFGLFEIAHSNLSHPVGYLIYHSMLKVERYFCHTQKRLLSASGILTNLTSAKSNQYLQRYKTLEVVDQLTEMFL